MIDLATRSKFAEVRPRLRILHSARREKPTGHRRIFVSLKHRRWPINRGLCLALLGRYDEAEKQLVMNRESDSRKDCMESEVAGYSAGWPHHT
jgi:hypothetical protein